MKVESLVPPELRDCGIDEFLERLPAHDAAMSALVEGARRERQVLRYVARLTADGLARRSRSSASMPVMPSPTSR